GPDCSGVARALDGVWDARVRSRIGDAFGKLGPGYAPAAWSAIAKDLDGYAGAWLDARRAVCQAGDHRDATGAIDRQRACLDERRAALARLTTALATPDTAMAQHAATLVPRLPAVTDCATLEYLAAVSTAGGAPDRVREDLASARADYAIGAYAAALAAADRALSAARAAGDRALIVEATYERARALALLDRVGESLDAYRAEVEAAGAIDATPLQIDGWTGMSAELQQL